MPTLVYTLDGDRELFEFREASLTQEIERVFERVRKKLEDKLKQFDSDHKLKKTSYLNCDLGAVRVVEYSKEEFEEYFYWIAKKVEKQGYIYSKVYGVILENELDYEYIVFIFEQR